MKTLRWIFLLLFVLTVVYAGFIFARELPEINRISRAKQEKETNQLALNKTIGEVNLKYRGFLESGSAVPESLKTSETGNMMRIQKEYQKQLYKMENEERELKRLIRKDDRKLSKIYSGLKSRFYVAGGLVLLFLAGAIITSRAVIRS